MKVTLLVGLQLSLHIWICTCETKQNDDLKSYENELIKKKMRSSLQYIQASDRPTFLIRCGGGSNCTTKDITNIRWLAGTAEIAKNRFWQTYSCFKAEDIKTCPVDGHWGAWSPWSKCTAGCGEEANSTRSRLCNNPHPVNEGLTCSGYNTRSSICRGKCYLSRERTAALVESEAFLTKIHQAYPRLRPLCLLGHCLYDQAVSVLQPGDAGKYWSSLQCVKYKRACPVDGDWASWTHWSTCESKCGSGIHWRVRNCTQPPPANNGLICRGPFYEEEPCVGRQCEKKDFALGIYMSDWSKFGPCSVSCGRYGVRNTRRVCLSPGKCGGLVKKNGNEIVIREPCFRGPCPADGKWSMWSLYTECSADCGKGRKIRIRTCDGIHSSDSAFCTGQSVNVTLCENRCKKDPTLVNGTAPVTASPFVPVQKVPPKVWKLDPQHPYVYELEPDRLGHFTHWSAWSRCSKSCETGQKLRSRKCTVAGRCFGEVRQTLFCNTDKCQVNGGWSKWLAWSHCTVTCERGYRLRYRKCDNPPPQFGGTCFGKSRQFRKCDLGTCKGPQLDYGHWAKWASCSKQCGVGVRLRSRNCHLKISMKLFRVISLLPHRRMLCHLKSKMWGSCGQMPCQVAGDWAHWGSWSACSHSCGGGLHFRDRTCTDPAPLYGGKHCKGHGSEMTPCFHGPCPDREDTGVRLNGSSGLLYSPFHKPQSYLSLHLLLQPLRPHGTIVYRSRACNVGKCRHSVTVSLVDGKPHVVGVNRESRITIKSNTTLQVREWHTVYVYLSQYHGFLRVNNGAHLRAEYHPKPSVQVNYDSGMTLGAKTDNGFVGVIAEANVNFQMLSLRRVSGWNGNGMPEDDWLTQSVHVDPVTKYPKFYSDTFIKLSISDIKRLNIQMSIWPQQLEGLVLFNEGRIPGSFVYLIIHKGVLRFCFNCGQLSVCENVQDVESMRWYRVSIIVSGIMSSIRINLGKAVQLTSPGLPYYTGSHVFVGGGESQDWVIFTAITGTDRGFSGTFHEVTINGQHYTLRTQPLENSRGFMNTEGVSSTEKIMEILERSDSKVVLRCDFSHYAHSESDVYVEWFNVDKKIKSSPDRKITPRVCNFHYQIFCKVSL
ncbi:SCO-spondin-like [Mizuhopecten yessoensis]|uniref:SCO-spondin-like n=1 Tax=Mizuhopecten yessoensis TaxID=6573 RepID=UPI000B45F50F|nr:SCO-spondin-like [Mizuhopecten yessoensis]